MQQNCSPTQASRDNFCPGELGQVQDVLLLQGDCLFVLDRVMAGNLIRKIYIAIFSPNL